MLLLFLYLEIFTLLGFYYKQDTRPVRYSIYIAIVTLVRYVVLGLKEMSEWLENSASTQKITKKQIRVSFGLSQPGIYFYECIF
ncbi:MAG: phosphate-starvation-inducible PsiE family protein [Sulfuriferula sp.]